MHPRIRRLQVTRLNAGATNLPSMHSAFFAWTNYSRGLAVQFAMAAWGGIRCVLDLLFDASADVGEWFVRLPSLAGHKVGSPRPSSTS